MSPSKFKEPLVEKEFSGRGFCPYDPRHNSTSIYAGILSRAAKSCLVFCSFYSNPINYFPPPDGELYAGTVADFSATDSLVIKKRLRTEQYDLKHLNQPHFVHSFEDKDHVYFFFRESAVEYMNCGKVLYFVTLKIVSMFSRLDVLAAAAVHEAIKIFVNPQTVIYGLL